MIASRMLLLRAALRRGETLTVCGADNCWSLGPNAQPVEPDEAQRLLADRGLNLRPHGDQLPGFPPDLSQSWSVPPRAPAPAPDGDQPHG